MTYHLTINYGDRTERRTETGTLASLCDALYDAGALGITAVRK